MKVSKSNAVGIIGIAASLGIVAYAAYKSHKARKQVEETITNEKLDEKMTEAIKDVSSNEFSDSSLERSACSEVLKGYRSQVLNAANINDMRTAYTNFTIAYDDMKSGKAGIYFRCSNYLRDIRKANEKKEDNSVGDLVEIVLKVTQTGVEFFSAKGGEKK